MPAQARNLSAALLDAQQRLQALRQNLQVQRPTAVSAKNGRSAPEPAAAAPDQFAVDRLPSHLGWESAAVTASLRTAASRPAVTNDADQSAYGATAHRPLPHRVEKARATASPPTAIKLYPDLAVGLLRQNEVTVGRIWLLLRHLDAQGRGWLTEEAVRAKLTQKQSEYHVCGWRHLRSLLARGEGLFWQRQNGRLWLRSLVKVAHALDVRRITAKPVQLPVSVLTRSIGKVRAHIYASFHSGRSRPDEAAKPIARETIAKVTTVQPRIQRLYEKKARVKQQRNFGVGPVATAAAQEEQAWQRGNGLFQLTDTKGLQGRPGVTYLAWQLPNSYVGPHSPHPHAQNKQKNRELVDLSLQGTTGNGRSPANSVPADVVDSGRRYCENGRIAARLHNRRAAREVYWRDRRQNGRTAVWQVMSNA